MTSPSPTPRRKSARGINVLMRKMVQLKIVQPGQNKEDSGSTIYATTPEFMAFMAEAKERYLSRVDKLQQLVMSYVNPIEEGSLARAQTILTCLMIAECRGGGGGVGVFCFFFFFF